MSFLNRFTLMFRSGDLDRDLDDELRSHIEMRTRDNVEAGMSAENARRDALMRFGNVARTKEQTRAARIVVWVESLGRDLRHGLRQLRRSPGFAVVAVLTLALGIGANTAIFQLIDAVRLRALPVRNPDELVAVDFPAGTNRSGYTYPTDRLTYPLYQQILTQQQAFSGVLAWSSGQFNLAEGGEVRMAEGLLVSGDFFRVLGVEPRMGRVFASQDDTPACTEPGAVISHSLWQREFGGDPGVLGRTISVEGHRFPVLGVTPESFFGVEVGTRYEVAVPLCSDPLLSTDGKGRIALADVPYWWVAAMGRLKPGWKAGSATAHLQALSPAIMQATLPESYHSEDAKRYLGNKLLAIPASGGVSELRGHYERSLWLLLATTSLVLLIACANLANLLLARASARQREIAVRLAMGASRTRLMRQLLTESLLLAAAGAVLGGMIAIVISRGLVTFLDTQNSPVFLGIGMDPRMLAFTTAIAVTACLLFGLFPALRATHMPPAAAMHSGGRSLTTGRERHAMRRVLVATQVALSLVLLFGALLFVRSLRNLSTVDLGFEAEGVLSVAVDLRRLGNVDRFPAVYRELLEHLSANPGVISAAQVGFTPVSGRGWNGLVGPDGQVAAGSGRQSDFSAIGSGYFRTMGTALLAGRDFSEDDTPSSSKVAIVNEEFARRYFGGANPVGGTFRRSVGRGLPEPEYRIVGLVKNSKQRNLREKFLPIAFVPLSQSSSLGATSEFVVRVNGPIADAMRNASAAVAEVSPAIDIRLRLLPEQLSDSILRERLMATLSGAFGFLAAMLAALGLYGVISYMASQRKNEIGVRMALGAKRSEVVLLVLREAALLVVVGLAAGMVLALWAGQAASSLLFGIAPNDALTLSGAAGLLAVVALISSYIPARRAAGLDPMVALRNE